MFRGVRLLRDNRFVSNRYSRIFICRMFINTLVLFDRLNNEPRNTIKAVNSTALIVSVENFS